MTALAGLMVQTFIRKSLMLCFLAPGMDIVLIGPLWFSILFAICTLVWYIISTDIENDLVRLRLCVCIFLLWFVANWLFIMTQLLSPVSYEPAPIVPGLRAFRYDLPIFAVLSIPFVIDLIRQSRGVTPLYPDENSRNSNSMPMLV